MTVHYQKDNDDLAQELVPNLFKKRYDPNIFESMKKEYKGPKGFDGALATGYNIINGDDDLNTLYRRFSKRANENNDNNNNGNEKIYF